MIDVIKNAVRPPLAAAAAWRIRRFLRSDPGYDDTAEFIARVRTRGDCDVRILQKDGEIAALCRRVHELAPRIVVEIGTAGGGTLMLLAEAAPRDATLISLDLPHPVGYRRHRERVYAALGRGKQRIVLLREDSHEAATVERVRAAAGAPVDFLFIDGDHSAAGVSRDFVLYAPLVRPGGLIAFHDIVPGPEKSVGGVPAFWRDLKPAHPEAEEFVEDWQQGGYGIGVVRAGGAPEHE